MVRLTVGVFPASGKLAESTTKHLVKLIPAGQLILINRYPDKVPKEYVAQGAQVREASYESSPEHFVEVLAGVDVLFLVSYPSFVHEYRVKVRRQTAICFTQQYRDWNDLKCLQS